MTTLDEITEKMNEEIFRRYNYSNTVQTRGLYEKRGKPILLFPRKKLRVEKLKTNGEKSKVWLIRERLSQRDVLLERPTERTEEALTSGLRSAIVRDKNGDYVRIKGIAPTTYLSQKGYRGLCSLTEAFSEQICERILHLERFNLLPMKSLYIEAMLVPELISQGTIGAKIELSDFANQEKIMNTHHKFNKGNTKNLFKSFKNFFRQFSKLVQRERVSFASAFTIEGDTRLDEVIYHLTKRRLSGQKRLERDRLLHYCCFWAGYAKGVLTVYDRSWSSDLEYTNNHIGNFVIYPTKKGVISAGICDVSGIKLREDFESRAAFIDYIEKEISSFRNDFHDNAACCFPVYLPYRHFSQRLRDECFNALNTGYLAVLYDQRKSLKLIYPLREHKKIVCPIDLYISEDEFKETSARILH